ncbi:reverse transcriptase family protein [Epilithonimonas sp.]|uniref:reverse transcriptase family protein n=1 Tax=Epilithonimonas sp. TaxID=2894511 RepID=UPI0035B45D11
MKTYFSEEQNNFIKFKFSTLSDKKDVVELLNIVNKMMFGEKSIDFDLKLLMHFANPELSTNRFKTFQIKKKSGSYRTLNSPIFYFKAILRCFSKILEVLYLPNDVSMGFTVKKSIVDNAKIHMGANFVYNIDLEDFFHSFDRNKVKLALMSNPFNLYGYKEKLAFFLACLFTHPINVYDDIKLVLPQGSPVSPILTNILCQKLDRRLNGLAKRFKSKYSRYADDITFSSNENVFINYNFQKELKRIIEEDQQLIINNKKTRLQKKGFKQEVTGLTINEKVNVSRKYIKQLRMWIYFIEKYGLDKAENIFRRDYIKERGYIKNINNPMINVLNGKLTFLKMVKGDEDETYLKLCARLNKIIGRKDPMDILIETWSKYGIQKAMDFYYSIEQ